MKKIGLIGGMSWESTQLINHIPNFSAELQVEKRGFEPARSLILELEL